MVKFNSYLQRAQIPEWKEYYIDYESLKEEIRELRKRRRRIQRGDNLVGMEFMTTTDEYQLQPPEGKSATDTPDDDQRLSNHEREEFCRSLQDKYQKSNQWYQTRYQQLQQQKDEGEREDIDSVLQLYSFCVSNVLTVRQIILKYNAHARNFHSHPNLLSEQDIFQATTTMASSSSSSPPSLVLLDLRPLQELLSKRLQSTDDTNADKILSQANDMQELLSDKHNKLSSPSPWTKRDRFVSTIRYYYLLLGNRSDYLRLEPTFLLAKGRHLKEEMKRLAQWREEQGSDQDTNKMDPANVWPLILNLISCFLFMMNNYIIEPSSAYYAEALGSSDALSGLMIGAASWFALMSAIGYSIWTNTSYRRPILFAGTLMVIGNTMYASAYTFSSMEICLLGRAISGLGAPRIINRRYVADATPFALRTMSSAAFALTTALGAALGPGLAIVLEAMPEFQFQLPLLGTQYFNGMTGPGYFMALSWFLYSVTVFFTFTEPNRSGLEELKRREQQEKLLKEGGEVDGDKEQGLKEPLPMTIEKMETFVDDDDSVSTASRSTLGDDGSQRVSKHSPLYCIKHMTRATALCMGLIFMKRIALESIIGSTSIITKNRYGWSIQNVGTLHLVNGLIVIPISVFAGWLSQYYEDRFLATWFMAVTALGMVIMVDPTDLVDHASSDTYNEDNWLSVGPVRYIIGSLIAFSGIESCESFVASLMSKVVPSSLAVGTFNSGLLATLVGTSGRAVGDLFITLMGLCSIRNLLNLLILPGLFLMLYSIYLLRRNYTIVAV